MRKIWAATTVVLALMAAGTASAGTYGLTGQAVQGAIRYCKYSNNRVYTYNATDLCPVSVETDDPPRMDTQTRSVSMSGQLTGEQQDGITKICTYSVMGRERSIRISSVGICPLTHSFD